MESCPPPSSSRPTGAEQWNTGEFLIPRFLTVASLTLCVWDWLLQAADEYEMARKSKGRLSRFADVLYFIARAFPIAYIWSNVIIQDGLGRYYCQTTIRFAAVVNVFTVPAISLLFLLRVTAVYLHNRTVMAIFGVCWLGLLCSFVLDSLTIFSGFIHLSEMRECSLVGRTTDAWAYVASAIFDTLIFLAISWRLVSTSMIGNSWSDRLKSFTGGEGLLGLSKVLLRGGQFYYVVTIGFNTATAVTTLAPGMRDDWWGLLAYPSIAIQSVMACRLFRELKLGVIVDCLADETGIATSVMFASAPHTTRLSMELDGHVSHMHESYSSGISHMEILNESDGLSQPDASIV